VTEFILVLAAAAGLAGGVAAPIPAAPVLATPALTTPALTTPALAAPVPAVAAPMSGRSFRIYADAASCEAAAAGLAPPAGTRLVCLPVDSAAVVETAF
jgi:hypothetical protein